MALNQGGLLAFKYVIPIFLIMIFAAALFSSKTKIPHTMILLGFGVCISLISMKGLVIPNFNQFNINPNLVIIPTTTNMAANTVLCPLYSIFT